MNANKGKIKSFIRKILSIKDTPNALAKGVASGIFAALTPFFGIKLYIALFLTWLIRGNIASSAISILSCNLIVPLLPIVMAFQYFIGFWIIHQRLAPSLTELKIQNGWQIISVLGWPLVLGSLLTACFAWLIVYYLMRYTLTRSFAKFHHEKVLDK